MKLRLSLNGRCRASRFRRLWITVVCMCAPVALAGNGDYTLEEHWIKKPFDRTGKEVEHISKYEVSGSSILS